MTLDNSFHSLYEQADSRLQQCVTEALQLTSSAGAWYLCCQQQAVPGTSSPLSDIASP
jgi:hypothetical protein